MREALPPIAFLRAFSRAAETLSLKEAAADLNLSPSAVSRQIQSLEAHLGVTLFRRLNPGLEVTEEGLRYLETVNRVLGELRRAQDALAGPRSGPLRVSALESFTESWLIPHLSDFERAHSGIELQVEATLRYADFERDPVDVAIRFGTGPWAGLHSEPIVDLTYFPGCPWTAAEAQRHLRPSVDRTERGGVRSRRCAVERLPVRAAAGDGATPGAVRVPRPLGVDLSPRLSAGRARRPADRGAP
jgi:LysR family glycine cleavage system transcriptional activator